MSYWKCIFLLLFIVFLNAGCRQGRDYAGEEIKSPQPSGLQLEKTISDKVLRLKISRPCGVAVDINDNLYLVDSGNDRIIKFDSNFNPLRDAGGYGFTEGLLSSPSYIAFDNNLNLYISETGNQRISIFDARLNYVDKIELIDTDDPLKYGRPSGIAVNRYGELLVADLDKSRLVLFNNVGAFDKFIADVETSSVFVLKPGGMTFGRNGDILLCDGGNALVRIFDEIGTHVDNIGRDYLTKPSGVTVDAQGRIWVADSGDNSIYCFDYRGGLLYSSAATGPTGGVNLNKPLDLAVTSNNRLIVSDSGNDRVLVFKIIYP